MAKEFAALFDLDGVILDTEPQYDVYWRKTAKKYHLGEGFENKVKGTTDVEIMNKYFSHFSPETRQKILDEAHQHELQMDMIFIPGALEFLEELKSKGIKMALVTSSNDKKLGFIFKATPIRPFFDSVVSADRVTRGKPDPMPYLLAAEDLNIAPENCFVFEDSINGIKSGNAAGMKVIALSTTNPKEMIENDAIMVISDFRNFHVKDLSDLS